MRDYRYTEADAMALESRLKRARTHIDMPVRSQPQAKQAQQKPVPVKRRGVMNGLEARFANEVLTPRTMARELINYEFEPITFRMRNDAKYTPDFLAVEADGSLTFFETKGHWRDAAKLRIKWAAQKFPMFKFVAVQRKNGVWCYENF